MHSGHWRDGLSPKQVELIENIMGPILSKYF
jgi:hypothetical protein